MYTFESRSLLQFANGSAFPPLLPLEIPEVTDLAGYDVLIELIRREKLDQLAGDFLEIGCFLGGGTARLAQLAASIGKQVWVVDPFDSRLEGISENVLHARTQKEIFDAITAPWSSTIQVLKQDSTKVRFPDGLRFSFASINASHDPKCAKRDCEIAWRRLMPGGWAGFHEYESDLPEVTAAVDSIMHQYGSEISRVEKVEHRRMLLVEKARG